MHLRPELPGDVDAVYRVNVAAFPTDYEARLVNTLRDAGQVLLSLVAEEAGEVLGHALYSLMASAEPSDLQIAGLGPLAVSPGWQRRGVGSALMRYGIERLREMGFDAIVLLGSTEYYPRFGYVPASDLKLHPADADVPASHFQALLLRGEPPSSAVHLHYCPQFFQADEVP